MRTQWCSVSSIHMLYCHFYCCTNNSCKILRICNIFYLPPRCFLFSLWLALGQGDVWASPTWPPSHLLLCDFDSEQWAVKSRKPLHLWVSSEWLEKGPYQTPSSFGLWRGASCLPLFSFQNRQNKLGFLWDLRLLHSRMAVLHYCLPIPCCSYTSRITCQRELSGCRMTCAILNFYNSWYAWMFCTHVLVSIFHSSVSNKLLCTAPQQKENDNNLTLADRRVTPPNTVYLPSASSTVHDGKQIWQVRPISESDESSKSSCVPVWDLISVSVAEAPLDGLSCRKFV